MYRKQMYTDTGFRGSLANNLLNFSGYKWTNSIRVSVIMTVFISVALFLIFVTAFFFTATKNIEKSAVVNNVSRGINEIFDPLVKILNEVPSIVKPKIQLLIQQNLPEQKANTEADAIIKEHNHDVMIDGILLVAYIVSGVIVICITVYLAFPFYKSKYDKTPDVYKIFQDTLVVTFIVAIVEAIFMFTIARSWHSVDVNSLMNNYLEEVISKTT